MILKIIVGILVVIAFAGMAFADYLKDHEANKPKEEDNGNT